MSDSESDSGSVHRGKIRREGKIRYGDHIMLKHIQSGRYLASDSKRYQGGSGQQRVFAGRWEPSEESEWIVIPPRHSKEEAGYEVGWDDPVRLKHVRTRANLHTHNIESPVTHQQEVSCFGDDAETDENDVWLVKRWNEDEDDDFWRVDEPFILRHETTGAKLHSHEHPLSDNINEVTGFDAHRDENDKWVVTY